MKRKIFVLTLLMVFLTATAAYSFNLTPKVFINNVEVKAIVHENEVYIPLSAVKQLGVNIIETNGAVIVQKQATDLKEAYEIMKRLDQKLAQRIKEYTENLPKAGTKEKLEQLALNAANVTASDIPEIESIVPGNFYVLLAKNSLHAMYNQAFSSFIAQANAAAGSNGAKELVQRYQQSKAVGFEMSELFFKSAMRIIERQLLNEGKIKEQAY